MKKPLTIKLYGPPVLTNYSVHFKDIAVTFDDGSSSTNVMVTYTLVLAFIKYAPEYNHFPDALSFVTSKQFNEAVQLSLLTFALS